MIRRFHMCLKYLVITGLAVILPGCIEATTLVKVNKDGSGILRMRVTMDAKRLEAIAKSMMPPGAEQPPIPEGVEGPEGAEAPGAANPMMQNLFNREQLVASAKRMGEGVRLVRAQEVNENGKHGFIAEYAFDDITKLRPEAAQSKETGQGGSSEAKFRFEFVPGDPAELVIVPMWEASQNPNPQPMMPPQVGGPAAVPEAREMEMMKQMFDGMVMSFYVQVNGEITETNASFPMESVPNTITVMYLNFGQLLEATQDLQQFFNARGPDQISQLSNLKLPGLRIEDPHKRISVKFQ